MPLPNNRTIVDMATHTWRDGTGMPFAEVSYQQALLTREFERHLDATIREAQARLVQWLRQPLYVLPSTPPTNVTDQLPDHGALPMEAFTAHVDAVLADCARWLAEVQDAQGE
jgi:hypothetical protein